MTITEKLEEFRKLRTKQAKGDFVCIEKELQDFLRQAITEALKSVVPEERENSASSGTTRTEGFNSCIAEIKKRIKDLEK